MGMVSRVESHQTAIGIPDVLLLLYNGPTRFIELKYTRDTRVVVRPAQIRWHREARRAGHRTAILTKIEWARTSYILNINRHPFDNNDAAHWINCADACWDDKLEYDELEELLRRDT